MKDNDLQIAINLFKSGKSISEIAKTFEKTSQTILKWLKDANVRENRSRTWVNSEYFDTIDTEEKAYLLGFFIADGSIRVEKDKRTNTYYKRLCLSNSIDDLEIIKRFHKAICPYHTMQNIHNTRGAKYRKPQIMLQWTSNHMVQTLEEKYKILPLKTYDYNFKFPFETIPSELHRHFVRGFLDGDGCVRTDGLGFVFNSENFMFQIMNIFEDALKNNLEKFKYTYSKCIGKTVNYWKCFIAKGSEKQKLLKDFLYKDATIYLTRKFNKINQWTIKKKGRPKSV